MQTVYIYYFQELNERTCNMVPKARVTILGSDEQPQYFPVRVRERFAMWLQQKLRERLGDAVNIHETDFAGNVLPPVEERIKRPRHPGVPWHPEVTLDDLRIPRRKKAKP